MNSLQTMLGILLLACLMIVGSATAEPVAQTTPADQFPLTTLPVTLGQLGTTPITGVIVTGTAIGNIIVTAAVASGPGTDTGVPLPPGTVYTYVDISAVTFKTITGAVISFIVPQSWLDEHHIAPQDIIMYQRVGSDWQSLPTTLVQVTNGQANYTAASPGFSRFAITGQPAPVTSALSEVSKPVTTQTSAVPASKPAPGLPLTTIGIAGIVVVVLGSSVLLMRRWGIRR